MKEPTETHERPPSAGVGHETRDISTRVVVIFALSLVAGAIVIHFVVWVLFLFYGSLQARAYPREYPMAQVGPPALPPAPRLQAKPRDELKDMRHEEDQYLESYGWVNQGAGVAHIPIDQAMQLLLRQGLPSRPPGETPPEEGMPEVSSSGRTTVPRDRY